MRYRLRDAIGIALISGFLSALGMLFFKAIPGENEQLITYMLGQLSGFAGGIVAYHYSSTAGSQHKSDLLAQRATNAESVEVRAETVNVEETKP